MPGIGLLVLRLCLGTSLIVRSALYMSAQMNQSRWTLMGGLGGMLCGIFLLIGFVTPLVSVLALSASIIAIASAVSAFSGLQVVFGAIDLYTVCSMLVAIAVILLGPGAFSLDARLFGRREIIIPTSNRRPNP